MSAPLWTRSDEWVGSEIEDAFVMVNIETGKYVALNQTAMAIWTALESPSDQPAIERALCDAFAVSPEDCHRSVSTTLAHMQDLQLTSQT